MKKKIIGSIFGVLIFLIVLDFVFFRLGKFTFFTPIKIVHSYDDGTVIEKIGLGYKEIIYKRSFYEGKELKFIFEEMKYAKPIILNVNEFVEKTKENKDAYAGKYVQVKGKIYRISASGIVLSSYEGTQGQEVGNFVVFDDTVNISCLCGNISGLSPYEDVEVIAKVGQVKKWGQTLDIKLNECILLKAE